MLCTDTDGMTGLYDGDADWSAWDSIEPLFGMGYAEIYEWRDPSGVEDTFATFVDDTTFVAAFAWYFVPRDASPVPADCMPGFVEVEGRRQ